MEIEGGRTGISGMKGTVQNKEIMPFRHDQSSSRQIYDGDNEVIDKLL